MFKESDTTATTESTRGDLLTIVSAFPIEANERAGSESCQAGRVLLIHSKQARSASPVLSWPPLDSGNDGPS